MGDVGPLPPEGICVNAGCVHREDRGPDATVSGPLTVVPARDLTVADLAERTEVPVPMLRDQRTGLWWTTDRVQAADRAEAWAYCDGLPPVREGPERWRLPDLYELASMVVAEDPEGAVGRALGADRHWWTDSVIQDAQGERRPVLAPAGREALWYRGDAAHEVRCVYGVRPVAAPSNVRTQRVLDRVKDFWTRLRWQVRRELTQAEAVGCGAGQRAPTVGELVTLVALRVVPEFLLDPDRAELCVWGPPSGDGRWRLRPYLLPDLPFLDVALAGDRTACLLVCVEVP